MNRTCQPMLSGWPIQSGTATEWRGRAAGRVYEYVSVYSKGCLDEWMAEMKLYVFDSCPYCVRVRALAGLKGIRCELVFPVAGSLPAVLGGRVARYSVPVLEYQVAGMTEPAYLQESGAIIQLLDQLDQQPVFAHYEISKGLNQWIKSTRPLLDPLCYPRMRLLDLPELASPEALKYFNESRAQRLGMPLARALEETAAFTTLLAEPLTAIAEYLDMESYFDGSRAITVDDLYAFAELRILLMVQELALPGVLNNYLQALSRDCSVRLYPRINRFGDAS